MKKPSCFAEYLYEYKALQMSVSCYEISRRYPTDKAWAELGSAWALAAPSKCGEELLFGQLNCLMEKECKVLEEVAKLYGMHVVATMFMSDSFLQTGADSPVAFGAKYNADPEKVRRETELLQEQADTKIGDFFKYPPKTKDKNEFVYSGCRRTCAHFFWFACVVGNYSRRIMAKI